MSQTTANRAVCVLAWTIASASATAIASDAKVPSADWRVAPAECRPALERVGADLEWPRGVPCSYSVTYKGEPVAVHGFQGIAPSGAAEFKFEKRAEPIVESGRQNYASSRNVERVEFIPELLQPADFFGRQKQVGRQYGAWADEKQIMRTVKQEVAQVLTGEKMLWQMEQLPLVPVFSVHRFADEWFTAPWSARRLAQARQAKLDPVVHEVQRSDLQADGYESG